MPRILLVLSLTASVVVAACDTDEPLMGAAGAVAKTGTEDPSDFGIGLTVSGGSADVVELSVSRAIGPRLVIPSAIAEGTIFAAPNGMGITCSVAEPCSLDTAADVAMSGDVVFLRGGTYPITENLYFQGKGTNPAPIRFESYPGEWAVLDGGGPDPNNEIYIRVVGDSVELRLFEVRGMPWQGIVVRSNGNLLEGLVVRESGLSGIHIHKSYDAPASNDNLITDCTVWGNSGAGMMSAEFANGGNSDGISISSGSDNRVENCLVYGNSDDGIDTWRSQRTYVGYSIAHSNGIADGDGQGIKAGGAAPSNGTVVERSIAYSNKSAGVDQNTGVGLEFRHNTTWDNGRGFLLGDDTYAVWNLAYEWSAADGTSGQSGNSWQARGTPSPMSTDPSSPNFLRPDMAFEAYGAHAP